MSFVIPGIAVADVPMYLEKLYIDNYNKLAGINTATWYVIVDLTNIKELVYVMVEQIHDEAGLLEISYKVTIDGEVFQGDNIGLADSTVEYLSINPPTNIAVNPTVKSDTERTKCGFFNEDQAGAEVYAMGPVGGHAVKIEYRFDDAPGTNQKFYADVVRSRKEAV